MLTGSRQRGSEGGREGEKEDGIREQKGRKARGIVRKRNKNSTPTIALKLQVHDSLSPHMREHVHHLRITGSCSERGTSVHYHLVTHHIQYKRSSTECSYLLPLFSVPIAQGGSVVRKEQLGGRRRQCQRGKRQPPRSHHSAAGCVNDGMCCVCACKGNCVGRSTCMSSVEAFEKSVLA